MASGIMEIMDLIYGFQKFQVLYSCSSLGVFEELNNNSCAPMTAEAVAAKLQVNAGALGRLMNAAATIKLLNTHSAGPAQATKYTNSTTVEKFVVKSSPGSLKALVNKMGDMYMMFGKLSDSVRKGSCPIPMAASFGNDGINMDMDPTTMLIENMSVEPSNNNQKTPLKKASLKMEEKSESSIPAKALPPKKQEQVNNVVNKKQDPSMKKPADMNPSSMALYCNQSKQLEFMQVMHMFSSSDAKQVNQAFDLSQFTSACDLGGGTGAIGAHLAEKNPHMHVTVLDLPPVVAMAEHFIQDKPHNLSFQAGDFFKSPLPSADLYILSHVIHDWSAKDVDILLKRVYNALPKGGAVLVLEKCLNENKTAPFQTVFFDVGMLVLSEGQERTGQEYRTLLKRHKFSNILIKFLPKAMYRDAILARKE